MELILISILAIFAQLKILIGLVWLFNLNKYLLLVILLITSLIILFIRLVFFFIPYEATLDDLAIILNNWETKKNWSKKLLKRYNNLLKISYWCTGKNYLYYDTVYKGLYIKWFLLRMFIDAKEKSIFGMSRFFFNRFITPLHLFFKDWFNYEYIKERLKFIGYKVKVSEQVIYFPRIKNELIAKKLVFLIRANYKKQKENKLEIVTELHLPMYLELIEYLSARDIEAEDDWYGFPKYVKELNAYKISEKRREDELKNKKKDIYNELLKEFLSEIHVKFKNDLKIPEEKNERFSEYYSKFRYVILHYSLIILWFAPGKDGFIAHWEHFFLDIKKIFADPYITYMVKFFPEATFWNPMSVDLFNDYTPYLTMVSNEKIVLNDESFDGYYPDWKEEELIAEGLNEKIVYPDFYLPCVELDAIENLIEKEDLLEYANLVTCENYWNSKIDAGNLENFFLLDHIAMMPQIPLPFLFKSINAEVQTYGFYPPYDRYTQVLTWPHPLEELELPGEFANYISLLNISTDTPTDDYNFEQYAYQYTAMDDFYKDIWREETTHRFDEHEFDEEMWPEDIQWWVTYNYSKEEGFFINRIKNEIPVNSYIINYSGFATFIIGFFLAFSIILLSRKLQRIFYNNGKYWWFLTWILLIYLFPLFGMYGWGTLDLVMKHIMFFFQVLFRGL